MSHFQCMTDNLAWLPGPRSAYIHVPFCSHRCGYCNFALVANRQDLIEPYLSALEIELKQVLGQPQPVDTLFIGGGTPSHLPPRELQRLLELLQRWFRFDACLEFSCELNPVDCQRERLRTLSSHGVNRVSLGGQSFSARKLRVLERDHTSRQLREACQACGEIFENVSLDLIFAAPDETLAEWQADIAIAIDSPIQHLSTYGLTIERGAAFYGRNLRGQLREVDEQVQLAMYEFAIDHLTAHGWEHYEVSNFAKPGYLCKHNETYWLGNCWWAFGPGAASFLTDDSGVAIRSVNHRSTTAYIKRLLAGESAVAECERLTRQQWLRERLVFGLRRLSGVNLQHLDEQWGSPVRELFEPYLSEFLRRGWLCLDEHQQLRLTRAGLVISDSLWPDLLSETQSTLEASPPVRLESP